MHFRDMTNIKKELLMIVAAISCFAVISAVIHSAATAEVIERVVAVVNGTPITRSEFIETFEKSRGKSPAVTKQEVMQLMINRLIIYQEAKKMRLESPDIDDMIKEYLDIKVESTIIIKEADIESFYNKNKNEFSNKPYLSVHDDIEKYLYELEKNKRIKELINNLRERSNVRVLGID